MCRGRGRGRARGGTFHLTLETMLVGVSSWAAAGTGRRSLTQRSVTISGPADRWRARHSGAPVRTYADYVRIALAATRHGRADTQRGVDRGHSPLLSRVAGAYRPHRQVSRRFRAVSHRFREWVREGIAQVSRGVADIHRFRFSRGFARFGRFRGVRTAGYRKVSQGIAGHTLRYAPAVT